MATWMVITQHGYIFILMNKNNNETCKQKQIHENMLCQPDVDFVKNMIV